MARTATSSVGFNMRLKLKMIFFPSKSCNNSMTLQAVRVEFKQRDTVQAFKCAIAFCAFAFNDSTLSSSLRIFSRASRNSEVSCAFSSRSVEELSAAADIVVDDRDIEMAEGGTVDDGGGAEAGVGAAEGTLDSEVETAVLMGAGAGALAVRVGTIDGAEVDAEMAPESMLTRFGGLLFPAKNSFAVSAGSAESAGG